jgi:hypothetical protein
MPDPPASDFSRICTVIPLSFHYALRGGEVRYRFPSPGRRRSKDSPGKITFPMNKNVLLSLHPSIVDTARESASMRRFLPNLSALILPYKTDCSKGDIPLPGRNDWSYGL